MEKGSIVSDTPAVPLTLEGSVMLHQFFRFNWKAWRALSPAEQQRISTAAIAKLKEIAHPAEGATGHHSALYAQLGHKGDLMLVHLRTSFDELAAIELQLAQTEFYDLLEQTHSYLSAVELGLYESSAKTYSALAARDIQPHSPEWNAEIQQTLDRQSAAMASRLFPDIPETKYACFYPMDRKRSDQVNWYTEPMPDRQRMMHEHGLIGRRYADEVRQIISGSIGLDDWEWGVDLFANDPIVFKRLIYEMRFDEVSAKYALFGSFYVGIRLDFDNLTHWLSGTLA
jgi:chlorite dismutase